MHNYLEFEKPLAELEGKIEELKTLKHTDESSIDIGEDIQRMEAKASDLLKSLYSTLTPWQKVQVARHPDRPHTKDYVNALIDDFLPLCGDRTFSEDHAILCGLGWFKGQRVAVIGHEKGSDMQSRLKHNFGMARPEGYRKAVRIMQLAEKFKLPVLTFIDTAGAYPGIGAEERGQAEAIARSIQSCLDLSVPNISIIIGEGGSGGAIAIATSNMVLMLEHAIYSVISPEGAASILWRDSTRAQEAATNMKITAQDLLRFGIVDKVLLEPLGGGHRDRMAVIETVGNALFKALKRLRESPPEEIRRLREEKFLKVGAI